MGQLILALPTICFAAIFVAAIVAWLLTWRHENSR